MQTLTIEVEDNKVDILLNLIKNLKDDIVKSYTLTPNPNQNLPNLRSNNHLFGSKG